MKKHLVRLCLVVIVAISVCGSEQVYAIQDLDNLQGGSIITLEDCLEHAFTHSPKIKKAQNNVIKSKSKIGQTKSVYFPSLSANTGYYISQNDRGWDNSQNYHGITVGLSQKYGILAK